MALTLCPNCRLPVNSSAERCHLCATRLDGRSVGRHMSVAAVVAVFATFAVLSRRRA